jgi:Alpha-glutamyl/putrescinyl thymine pyrophosphorylase clade 2
MPPVKDERRLADLITFARAEVDSGDIEPWAEVIAAMTRVDIVGAARLDREQVLWLTSLYNTTDDLLSSLTIAAAAPSPQAWAAAGPAVRAAAAAVRLSQERRNLYGGRILRRLDSYAAHLAGQPQYAWVSDAIVTDDRHANFPILMGWLRRVWGVGRLSAFEWAEFLHKVDRVPVETTDGCLWESSGPRQSLERIYGPAPSEQWLAERAHETRQVLADAGISLSWWDFETVICDFNVMTKGRYYPGKHLAMISAEIAALPERWRGAYTAAYRAVIPDGWRDIAPGVDRHLCREYVTTGRVRTPLDRSSR